MSESKLPLNPGTLAIDDHFKREDKTDGLFKDIFFDSPSAMYICDNAGYIVYYNEAAVQLWGRRPEVGKDLWCGSWKIYDNDGVPMQMSNCPMAKALEQGIAFDKQFVNIETPDHVFKNLIVYARPIFDSNQKQIGAHNTLIDITEQRFTAKRQATLSAIVESSSHAIISKNLDGIITSWNKGAQNIFGYREEEIIGKSINLLIPDFKKAEEGSILSRVKQGNKVDHLRTIRIAKSGKEIPISLTVSPVKDSSGKIIGASKIARDITEEVSALKAIKRNTENLETLNAIGKIILEKLDVKVILQQVIDATMKIAGADFGVFYYTSVNEEGEISELLAHTGNILPVFDDKNGHAGKKLCSQLFQHSTEINSVNIYQDASEILEILKNLDSQVSHPITSYLQIPLSSNYGIPIGCLIFGHPDEAIFTQEHVDIISSIASQSTVALDNSKLFEEVKALSAKKDEFIALASHELKTPITSIKGYLQISARTEKEGSKSVFIGKALTQLEKLNSLVNDLLDASKIVAGKLQFNLQPFDLQALVMEVVDTFSCMNQTHRIIFQPSALDYNVEADQRRIEQVMINLLSNAIKYSPGADKVYVTLDRDADYVQVKIKDEGIGLTISQQHKIFTRFYRAETPTNISGLGLGLYLTKEIIENHNGFINVNSEHGKGSEFYFSIPIKN